MFRWFSADCGYSQSLSDEVRFLKGPTAIMAGHYRVVYRPATGILPLLPSLAQDGFEKNNANNFSEESWALGLVLHEYLPESSVLLLVDDVWFRRPQASILKNVAINDHLKKYYAESDLPPTFAETALSQFGALPRLVHNNAIRPTDATLPAATTFFSESELRDTLPERRQSLLSKDGFGEVDNSLVHWPHSSPSCLIDSSGKSSCSGAALELFYRVQKQGFVNFVLYVPAACATKVIESMRTFQGLESPFENLVAALEE